MEIIKKISCKSVCGNVRRLLPHDCRDGDKMLIMQVLGYGQSFEKGKGKFKREGSDVEEEYTRFRGKFKAMDIRSGAWYFAAECFLPYVIGNLLEQDIACAISLPVPFAIQIGVIAEEKAATGYVYYAQYLIPTAVDDPFKALESQANINSDDTLEKHIAIGLAKEQDANGKLGPLVEPSEMVGPG